MKIKSRKKFDKKFNKLPEKEKQQIKIKIELFSEDPFHYSLRNHALSGKMRGLRAFSVGGNMRIIFQEFDDYILVIFLDLGSHEQVYR